MKASIWAHKRCTWVYVFHMVSAKISLSRFAIGLNRDLWVHGKDLKAHRVASDVIICRNDQLKAGRLPKGEVVEILKC